jgi:hypothetical protein
LWYCGVEPVGHMDCGVDCVHGGVVHHDMIAMYYHHIHCGVDCVCCVYRVHRRVDCYVGGYHGGILLGGAPT